jgi:adenosylcobinamide-GDP ribazoletransferase
VTALRLLFGTLTVLPVRPPASLDRRTAGRAMVAAPLAGLALAVLVVLPLLLLEEYGGHPAPLLVATLAVAALAGLTRAIHLDGLADTADGLGSGRQGEAALAVMKRPDIGPFGVATLALVLLVEVTSLATCLAAGTGPEALLVALVLSRTVLPVLCTRPFPAARGDGLGHAVAGSVGGPGMAVGVLLGLALAAAGLALLRVGPGAAVGADEALLWLLGLLPGLGLAVHARRRFGGVTGDVYGAAIEVTFASVLAVAALSS